MNKNNAVNGDILLFEVHSIDGANTWRLYQSGRIDGFPDGSFVLNMSGPYVHSYLVLGRLLQQCPLLLATDDQRNLPTVGPT